MPRDQVDVYVALGDSFSSGEGAPAGANRFWWEGRDTDRRAAPVNVCHRSDAAYPPIVARALGFTTTPKVATVPPPPPFEFVACSGALINELTGPNPTNAGEPPQLTALRDPDRHTDLVTVTIGGNDMGFATIIEYCLLVWSCDSDETFAPGMQRMIAGSRPILRATYQQIKSAASPDTHIAVLTYPQILPDTSCGITGWWALTDAELAWMQQLWSTFNIRVKGAAADVGIHAVDVESAFTGHRICDTVPYAHGIFTERRWDPTHNSMFSFHPNNIGHQILATEVLDSLPPPAAAGAIASSNVIAAWIRGALDDADAAAAMAVDEDPPVDPETELTTGTIEVASGAIGNVVTDPERDPTLLLEGFAPFEQVTVSMTLVADPEAAPPGGAEPAPVDLGTFVTDPEGRIEIAPTLPATEGLAVVLARGPNPFGGLHVATADLWLLGECRALAGFTDVDAANDFCEPIDWLADAGITEGLPDGTFRPTRALSRQGMAAFLYRLAGEPPFDPPTEPSFTDVPVGHPFYAEIEWLAATGITEGWPDGTFRPTRALSRQGMAAFLYRLLGQPPLEPLGWQPFSDVPADHPFAVEITWLYQAGISVGLPGGTFEPARALSRQAMAAFLYRMATAQLEPVIA